MEVNINALARDFTLMYADELDIPAAYKKGGNKTPRNSKILTRFHAHVEGWSNTIKQVYKLAKNYDQAHRIIALKPLLPEECTSAIQCQDFLDMTEILIIRRDLEKCSDNELGKLCTLTGALQKAIELEIHREKIKIKHSS